jgi:hypothetical protein
MSYTDVTPYVAATIATQALRAAGLIDDDVEIAPQSMYGNKTIERYGKPRREGGDGIMFVGDSFKQWLDAQLEGRTSTRSRVNVKALLAEYTAEVAEDGTEAGEQDGEATGVADESDGDELQEQLAASLDEVAAQADLSALEPAAAESE